MEATKNIEWEFTYSDDNGDTWRSHYFASLTDAREFAYGIAVEHDENPGFKCFARRFVVAATSDFFDHSKFDGNIRLAHV